MSRRRLTVIWSRDWSPTAIKLTRAQAFVIGGYTPPEGSCKYFGALLVGYYGPEGGWQFYCLLVEGVFTVRGLVLVTIRSR
jgi:ATP-dependent DNA ligase